MSNENFCCDQMTYAVKSPEVPVVYNPKFREFGIQILDGGTSILQINCCPWCGEMLPESLRNDWFDRLEKLGIDPATGEIPEEFRDSRWFEAKPK
jgi:hypothetical protein